MTSYSPESRQKVDIIYLSDPLEWIKVLKIHGREVTTQGLNTE